MTNGDKERLAWTAIWSLTLISVLGIVAGVLVAYFGSTDIGAIIALVSAAIGGIVAIVLREKPPPGGGG